ncbi:OsmC family protein [Nitriliruptoria bacterium AS10]|nr:OsmC family protein [Salsipaludibacter albus]
MSAARTGTRTYLGRNDRGDEVRIGPADAPGHFTPGELLKLALAGCSGMSADRALSRRLGDDVEVTVWAHGTSDPDTESYRAIDEELVVDRSPLDDQAAERLVAVVARAIASSCTIARTVDGCVTLTTTVDGVAR